MTRIENEINQPAIQPSSGPRKLSSGQAVAAPASSGTDRYRVFSRGNPIHDILAIESGVVTPQQTNQAYRRLEAIYTTLRNKIRPGMTPADKLRLFFRVLEQDFNFELKEQRTDPLLTTNLAGTGKRGLDCDTSLLILLACSRERELNWPISLADNIFGHIFARWDDGQTRLNVSYGQIYTDQFYRQHFNVTTFSTLNNNGVQALVYSNRGISKSLRSDYAGALQDYAAALRLNPNDALTYYNQGVAHYRLQNFGLAVASFNQVLRLNPNHVLSYTARGSAEQQRGNRVAARANFREAERLKALEQARAGR